MRKVAARMERNRGRRVLQSALDNAVDARMERSRGRRVHQSALDEAGDARMERKLVEEGDARTKRNRGRRERQSAHDDARDARMERKRFRGRRERQSALDDARDARMERKRGRKVHQSALEEEVAGATKGRVGFDPREAVDPEKTAERGLVWARRIAEADPRGYRDAHSEAVSSS